jgi:hypothetical protein
MERTKRYILPLMFMLVPLGFISFGLIHEGQHYALLIAFVAILATTVRNNWITAFSWYLCAWVLFICIYRMAHPTPQIVFTRAMEQLFYMAAGLAIYSAVVNTKNIKQDYFYNIICIAALIQGVIAISQSFGFDPVVWGLNLITNAKPTLDPRTMTGTLGNNNFLAAYLAISMPFFFRKNWFYGLILIIPVLYLCNTTSAIVPVIIGAMFFFYPRMSAKVKVIIGVVSAAIIFWYAVFQHTPIHTNPRWGLWAGVLKQVFYSPFTFICGYGPGAGWGQTFPMHNEWLQCLQKYGIIGLTLLAGYVLTIYRGNRMLLTAFIIAAINMFGNYPLHLAPSVFLIIIVAGLIEREKEA